MKSARAVAVSGMLVVSWTLPALAQVSANPPGAPAAPAGGSDVDRARRHYERGLDLYNEENYPAALVEMERAYQIAPSYRIQYNLARIYRQLNSYASSIRNYEAYLREGGGSIPGDRRAEVEKELSLLRTRVASLDVRVNVTGADVSIDDVPVGKAPLAGSVVVDPGRRKVTATKSGYAPASQVVSAAGSDAMVVKLTLTDLSRPADRDVDTAPRNRAIVAWTVTGALAGAATVFGILALNADDKLGNERKQFGVEPSSLDDHASKVRTFAILSDGFIIGSALAGGVATWLTIKAAKGSSSTGTEKAAARIDVGPMGARLRGTF